ncbi:MAG TPA: hypothetical protein VGL56_02565 [Fimbriimonadaceae bacterium]|jgi:hypothetical protein
MPSQEWIREKHQEIGGRTVSSLTLTDEGLERMDPANRFALLAYGWYKDKGMQMYYEQLHDRSVARAFQVAFTIENLGECPAEFVDISVQLPIDLPIKRIATKTEWSVQEVPEKWRLPVGSYPVPNSAWNIKTEWYFRSEPLAVRQLTQDEIFFNETTKRLWWKCKVLEHGSSAVLGPLTLTFDDKPAKSFCMQAKLHARNQPRDQKAELECHIVERT